jgi:hypothetical protein
LEPKRKETEQDQQRDREEVGRERLPSVFMLGTVWTVGSKTNVLKGTIENKVKKESNWNKKREKGKAEVFFTR